MVFFPVNGLVAQEKLSIQTKNVKKFIFHYLSSLFLKS